MDIAIALRPDWWTGDDNAYRMATGSLRTDGRLEFWPVPHERVTTTEYTVYIAMGRPVAVVSDTDWEDDNG